MNASRVIIQDVDQSFSPMGALIGISGFVGTFERGPINDPSIVITNGRQLRMIYGGPIPGNDDLLLAERFLNRGGQLRIVNIRHYTDVADPATLTATKPVAVNVVGTGGTPPTLFQVQPKYAGAKYNEVKVDITAPSNGQTAGGYFNLRVYIPGDGFADETYQNLKIPSGRPNAVSQTWLNDVLANSNLLAPLYSDLSGVAGTTQLLPLVPQNLVFTGAVNGGAVVATDFAGSPTSKTGFYALDFYNDMMDFSAPNQTAAAVHIAGANYANNRGDIEYIAHLAPTLTAAAMITARNAITVNSKYYSVFSGGVKIIDPISNQEKVVSEAADVMGIGVYVDQNFEPWFSQANYVRGFIPNAIGVGVNYGSEGSYPDLNLLANAQINMVVANQGVVYLKGNFSGQFDNSKASFRNVVRLIIYVKKTLRPILERYLEEPADFITFRNLFNEVQPFLQRLKDNRAVYDAVWQGDQDATKMSDLKINTPADLDQGKYQAILHLNPITALNEIKLSIAINSAGYTIEEV